MSLEIETRLKVEGANKIIIIAVIAFASPLFYELFSRVLFLSSLFDNLREMAIALQGVGMYEF